MTEAGGLAPKDEFGLVVFELCRSSIFSGSSSFSGLDRPKHGSNIESMPNLSFLCIIDNSIRVFIICIAQVQPINMTRPLQVDQSPIDDTPIL
ncbi:unnamed protein product [Strongylus vulgaris]|uniref:Uncharacterized protein n=1 Tax=Strongylus vulgaris TaxID=40348 RepID=A0A3P7J5C4_STRVU|nr:unnamed protein product [Strongylus vulgaris]